MITTQPTIIFSDLDGTLLDHFSYDFTAAKSTIEQLKTANIPIVLATSKTFAEVSQLQKQLAIFSPVIVENGAAIYMPKATFTLQPKGTEDIDGYWLKSFCEPRLHWLNIIAKTPTSYKKLFQGFSSLSTAKLVQITGLTKAEADLAKNRQYGEPVHWLADQITKQEFIEILKTAGAKVLQGGRFFHVSGDCDKGKALTWLTEQYQAAENNKFGEKKITTIALGDGENDSAMLEAATIAVQIRSPVHDFPLLSEQTITFKTKNFGPSGWAEAIQKLLSKQLSTCSHSNSTKQEVNHG